MDTFTAEDESDAILSGLKKRLLTAYYEGLFLLIVLAL